MTPFFYGNQYLGKIFLDKLCIQYINDETTKVPEFRHTLTDELNMYHCIVCLNIFFFVLSLMSTSVGVPWRALFVPRDAAASCRALWKY